MQVDNNDIFHSLSKEELLSKPYETIILICNSNSRNEADLYLIEECLHCILSKESHMTFMSCVGENLEKNFVYKILSFYVNFRIEVGIINSIIICHNLISFHHKEGLKLALLRGNGNKFDEFKSIKTSIFDQFPDKDSVNLNIYLNLYRLKKNKLISIYDHKTGKFITGSYEDLLNIKIYNRSSSEWLNDMEVYFNQHNRE